jgi:hypothetical protein
MCRMRLKIHRKGMQLFFLLLLTRGTELAAKAQRAQRR